MVLKSSQPSLERAQKAWGEEMPQWIKALAKACDLEGSSQDKVGRAAGASGSMVCQVLGNSYKGDSSKLEAFIRGKYLANLVNCPVMDEIGVDHCLSNARNTHLRGNPIRVMLAQTCPNCPHNPLKKGPPKNVE